MVAYCDLQLPCYTALSAFVACIAVFSQLTVLHTWLILNMAAIRTGAEPEVAAISIVGVNAVFNVNALLQIADSASLDDHRLALPS